MISTMTSPSDMTHQGTSSLLTLAGDLRTTAPHVPELYDLRKASKLMLVAADAIERLAPLEPEIEVVLGEH